MSYMVMCIAKGEYLTYQTKPPRNEVVARLRGPKQQKRNSRKRSSPTESFGNRNKTVTLDEKRDTRCKLYTVL